MILNAGFIVKLVLILLLLISITSWAIILFKYRVFRNNLNDSQKFLDVFWNSKKLDEIYNTTKNLRNASLTNVFGYGYKELSRIKEFNGGFNNDNPDKTNSQVVQVDTSNINRALRIAVTGEINRLESFLTFLATAGNASPFIGLFGTVWGIMNSFRNIGLTGSASLATVAPGISEALIATALGLFSAIPAVIAYNYFVNKIKLITNEMEIFSNDFLNIVDKYFLKNVKIKDE